MKHIIFAAMAAGFIGGTLAPAAVKAAGEFVTTGVIFNRTPETGFKFWSRDKVTDQPVATIQPTRNNSVVALDLLPKGSPAEATNDGFAWADICDRDIEAGLSNTTVCARIGARSSAMEFGTRRFGGAPAKPLWITMQGNPAIVVDTSGNTTITGQLSLNGNAAEALGRCNEKAAGRIAYDKSRRQFFGCNGANWRRLD
jgi:hypothetical protein